MIGTVFDKQTATQYLRDANRTDTGRRLWDSAVGSVTSQANAALGEAKYDLSTAMNEAYLASMGQKTAIENANIFGDTGRYEAQIDADLESAYQQYYNNYLQNVQKIQKSTTAQVGAIQTELDTRASNLEALNNSMYDYLQYVYSNFDPTVSDNKLFTDRPEWMRLLTTDKETSDRRLMTRDEFNETLWQKDPETDQYSFTEEGTDIYDMLMNSLTSAPGYEEYSYDAWLKGDDETAKQYQDAYKWAIDYNPFAQGGVTEQNIAEFKRMVGMMPDDYTYNILENKTDKNMEQLKAIIDTSIEELMSKLEKQVSTATTGVPATIKTAKEIVGTLKSLSEDFGIASDVDWDDVVNDLEDRRLGISFDDLFEARVYKRSAAKQAIQKDLSRVYRSVLSGLVMLDEETPEVITGSKKGGGARGSGSKSDTATNAATELVSSILEEQGVSAPFVSAGKGNPYLKDIDIDSILK